jgi:exonuclease III
MDPSRIFFWNVRGLNSVARQDYIRTLVNSLRVDVVCLQEIKNFFLFPEFNPLHAGGRV